MDEQGEAGDRGDEAAAIALNGALADAVIPFLGTLVGHRGVVRSAVRDVVPVRTLAELDRPAEEGAERDQDGQE